MYTDVREAKEYMILASKYPDEAKLLQIMVWDVKPDAKGHVVYLKDGTKRKGWIKYIEPDIATQSGNLIAKTNTKKAEARS